MLIRLIKWLIRRLGAHTVLSLLLLAIGLGSVAWALANGIRGPGLGLLLSLALGGVLLGWSLAAARPVPGWLAAVVIFILGTEAIIFRVGQLGPLVAGVGQHLANLAGQLGQIPRNGWPNLWPLGLALSQLGAALLTLANRMLSWGVALAANESAFDPVVTTIIWSLAVWGVSTWAAWCTRRFERPLLAMAPAGALLVTTLAYTLRYVDSLLPVLAATLLLLGLVKHRTRERRWQARNIDFPLSLRAELAIAVTAIAMGLMALAGAVPSLSIKELTQFTRQFVRSRVTAAEPVAGSLGLRPGREQATPALSPFRSPGLPQDHLLGSGPELSEQVALIVSTTQPPAGQPAPTYYWNSLTYDVYTGRGWRTSGTEQIEYAAGEPAINATAPGRRVLRQTVQVANPQAELLYATGNIVTVDHNFSVNWRRPGDAFGATVGAATYQVDTLVPAVSQAQLRTAGTNYPDWVGRQYLNLPKDIPNRVVTLARDLTATAPTPYDRAKAIETYLRTFTYNLDLPLPPSERDIVDYFLFDLQQGYCDYYATSMVVLARAAGLPARMAVGYIGGTYNAATGQYVVTQAEAHSWPEIYFPNYGWIEFEPTAARPVSNHTGPPAPAQAPEPLPPLTATPGRQPGFWWWLALPGSVLLLAAAIAAWSIADRWRLRRLTPVAAVAALYGRLEQQGQQLAVPLWAGETPYEFAAALTERMKTVGSTSRWAAALAPAAHEIGWLAGMYVRASYSPHRPTPTEQIQAIKIWQRLRLRLWLARASNFAASVSAWNRED